MDIKILKSLLKDLPKLQEHGYYYHLGQAILGEAFGTRVYNCVVFLKAKAYLRYWESLPQKNVLKLEQIEKVEFPPYCLSEELGQLIFNKVEPIHDSYIFYLRLKNGKIIQCQTDYIVNFLELPERYSVHDIDSLEGHGDGFTSRRQKVDYQCKGLEYYWCFY